MKTIIAVFGNLGHGKSTLANLFADLTGGKVIKVGRDGVANTVWVDRFLDAAMEAPESVVIAGDGRFPDEELHYLKTAAVEREAKVIGVVIRRPDYPVKSDHRSETVIAETPDGAFDCIVVNDSTEEQLGQAAHQVISNNGLLLPPSDPRGVPWSRQEIEGDRGPNYIRTFTGLKFWPLDPRPDEVFLQDIAHGTAGENRWSGMTRSRLNVAWHSNRVRRLALIVAPPKLRLLAGLYAQLHDAHEAYLKDIPRPLKDLLPDYEKAAQALDAVIFQHFGMEPVIPPVIYEIVETCDQWMAGVEARAWHNLAEDELPPKPPLDIVMAAGGYLTREPDPDEDEKEFVFHTIELLKALEMPYGAV